MDRRLTQLSKTISYALRHAPWEYELELDQEGWVSIDLLMNALSSEHRKYINITEADLNLICAQSSKQRFELANGKIRALYGHSITNKLQKQSAEPPDLLYHGTSQAIENIILSDGIRPMNRQYVHLSVDTAMAKLVGSRKDKRPECLTIDAKSAFGNGVKFYIGNEHVWLADFIPAEFVTPSK